MPTLNFITKYNYANELQISVSELVSEWMFGIPLKDNKGYQYSLKSIKNKILFAQSFLEGILSVKMVPTLISDKLDYISEEFHNKGYLRTTFPINSLVVDQNNIALTGGYNDYTVIRIPYNWLTFQRGKKIINMVPGMTGTGQMALTIHGTVFMSLNTGQRFVPDFWKVTY